MIASAVNHPGSPHPARRRPIQDLTAPEGYLSLSDARLRLEASLYGNSLRPKWLRDQLKKTPELRDLGNLMTFRVQMWTERAMQIIIKAVLGEPGFKQARFRFSLHVCTGRRIEQLPPQLIANLPGLRSRLRPLPDRLPDLVRYPALRLIEPEATLVRWRWGLIIVDERQFAAWLAHLRKRGHLPSQRVLDRQSLPVRTRTGRPSALTPVVIDAINELVETEAFRSARSKPALVVRLMHERGKVISRDTAQRWLQKVAQDRGDNPNALSGRRKP